jgi:peptidoglycan glycosyltransferase
VAAGEAPTDADLTQAELAACGYGQGSLLVTPLYLASVVQTIGAGGVQRAPYLVDRVAAPDGRTLRTHAAEPGRIVMSAGVAAQVLEMMRRVMAPGGTAAGLAGGLDVAGKTGSAQNPHGQAHSWFVALAPAVAPRYAVAVIVENAGWGRTAAAPVAIKVLKAALGRN